MGVYTGLRGWIQFKSEHRERIAQLLASEDHNPWVTHFADDAEMREFIRDPRASSIPRGQVCYMPDDWGENRQDYQDRRLTFTCSFKNFGRTLDHFLDVLDYLADEWNLESLYEECEESTKHVKEAGKCLSV